MTVILCVDDRFGMLFNRRRLSRDSAVTEDIVNGLSGGRLFLCDMSESLFKSAENTLVCEDFLEKAGENDFCFVEDRDIAPYVKKIDKIVLYHWNRAYPSDLCFDPVLLQAFRLRERVDFKGSSHEKITKEVYER